MSTPASAFNRTSDEIKSSAESERTASGSKTLLFSKKSEISFECAGKGQKLSVTIDTENLHMRSVVKTDLDAYAKLLGDQEVVQKFGEGKVWAKFKKDAEEGQPSVEPRLDLWVDRWEKDIPFSSFAIFKRDADDFAGHAVLGFGEEPKTSEIAYLFHKKCWKKGIGSEAVSAIVKEYAPELPKRGYLINGQPFEAIVATARTDNPASSRILKKVGGVKEKTSEKFGAMRDHFRIKI